MGELPESVPTLFQPVVVGDVTLGHRVVAQRAELEERIRQLQTAIAENDEEDDVNIELRMQYRDLLSTLGSWEDENTVLTGMFGGKVRLNLLS